MLYKLYTHIVIKHYVKKMTIEEMHNFLVHFEILQKRLNNCRDKSLQIAFNLMSIFVPYVRKEYKRY